ncbi:hypothetical protein HR12_38855 [Microbacterium sp. SUBG005]|nr:hypothetical protein HR12_38855 [Microbacterium sp. SUBG005]
MDTFAERTPDTADEPDELETADAPAVPTTDDDDTPRRQPLRGLRRVDHAAAGVTASIPARAANVGRDGRGGAAPSGGTAAWAPPRPVVSPSGRTSRSRRRADGRP